MKSALTFIAALCLTSSAFAELTRDQIRLKVARATEVKAISESYKKQGFKCQNTEVLSVSNGQVSARKNCFKDHGSVNGESSITMEIEAFLMDDDSEAIVTNIKFMIAG